MNRARRLAPIVLLVALTGCDDWKIKTDGDAGEFRFGSPVHLWLAQKDTPASSIAGVGSTAIDWTSSRDGAIGQGPEITVSTLGAGEHKIEARATISGKEEKVSRKIKILNDAPVARVTEPTLRSFDVGTKIHFAGEATDREDGTEDASRLSWTVDGAPRGTGASIDVVDLVPGTHRIGLAAVDKAGATGKTSIDVEITNQPPAAAIDEPAAAIVVKAYQPVTLRGHATDPDPLQAAAAVDPSRLRWSSSLSGFLGQGAELTRTDLAGGVHVITLTATDEFGAEGKAAIKVEVRNEPPKVKVKSPSDHSFFSVNQEVRFEANVSDEEDGTIPDDKIVWRSDQDGELGRGASLRTSRLRPGVHVVTCTATDGLGASSSGRVQVLIRNENPTAAIAGPQDGTTISFTDSLDLSGTGSDPEDGALDGPSLTWTFDGGKRLGFGRHAQATGRDLGFGAHVITLVATDSSGATSKPATVKVVVRNRPPEVRIVAPADLATVSSASLQLAGVARDPDRDAWVKGGAMSWTSTRNGATREIATGDRPTVSLEPGTHLITLTAKDPDDASLTGRASITITVSAGPATPTPATPSTPSTPGVSGLIPGGP